MTRKKKKIKIFIWLLGKHNVLNAAAAVTVCINLGVSQNIIKQSLKIFWRTKENDKNICNNKNDFYDDYAHHPTEIFYFGWSKKCL